MNLSTLIKLCRKYDDMGAAVQSQLRAVVFDGDALKDTNPHALDDIKEFLRLAAAHDVEDAQDEAERISNYLRKKQ